MGCESKQEMWMCVMGSQDAHASLVITHGLGGGEDEIGKTLCFNGGTKNCPVVGKAMHFGRTDRTAGLELGVNAKITGPIIQAAGGWYVEFSSGNTVGTPATVVLQRMQVDILDTLI